MAKRGGGSKRTTVKANTEMPFRASTVAAMDRQLVAIAQHVGRAAGTAFGKAESWADRKTLTTQIAAIRDGAAALLEQLAGKVKAAPATPARKLASRQAPRKSQGRSGGVVDAPGKKHRKPMPAGASAGVAKSQAAKLREAMPMAKTSRNRGRG